MSKKETTSDDLQTSNSSLDVVRISAFDHRESVMEEIKLYTGLDVKPFGRSSIELDTIAGRLEYTPMPEMHNVMADVYRFIQHYGGKLSKWGLENKLKALEH